jgi:PEGA domain-containing protein
LSTTLVECKKLGIASVATTKPAAADTVATATEEPEASVLASKAVGSVAISSEPNGAEIFVDEKFVGNAPAKLRLPAGTHALVLKSPGFVDWQRTMEVLKAAASR